MTASGMIAIVKDLTSDIAFDVISIGHPGIVRRNRPVTEPANLGGGWRDFDFGRKFDKPVKVVNDALLQAVGSYDGGRLLFLGLGTGLGSAMIIDSVAQPMELAHLPYKKKKMFEDYVGKRGMERRGVEKWKRSVIDVVDRLHAALQPDYIVIGGGQVDEIDTLPEGCRRGDNQLAFGGDRLWHDETIRL